MAERVLLTTKEWTIQVYWTNEINGFNATNSIHNRTAFAYYVQFSIVRVIYSNDKVFGIWRFLSAVSLYYTQKAFLLFWTIIGAGMPSENMKTSLNWMNDGYFRWILTICAMTLTIFEYVKWDILRYVLLVISMNGWCLLWKSVIFQLSLRPRLIVVQEPTTRFASQLIE